MSTHLPIQFWVSGEPKGQPRPRAFAMKMKSGKYSARVFEAGTAEGWKSAIAAEAVKHRPAAQFIGGIAVTMFLWFPRPKSHYRTGKHAHQLRPDAPYYHTSKPDADNCLKAALDAMTQIGGFWKDDSQVCNTTVIKRYAESAGQTKFEITSLEGTEG